MVTAVALLNVARGSVHEIAEELANMEPISEVYSVAGRYDLAVIVRAKDNKVLEELIADRMMQVKGIQKSETIIVLQVYEADPDFRTVF